MDTQARHFGEQFTALYTRLLSKKLKPRLQLIGPGRRKPSWLHGRKAKVSRAIKKGADWLPFSYQARYVQPLKANLDLVMEQCNASLIENLVGAVYDISVEEEDDAGVLSTQLENFLAVLSNLYRSFLAAQVVRDLHLAPDYWLPPLANFKYEATLDDGPTPYIFPPDETRLLFGGFVGVVVLPSTYRQHPVLWAGLSHEVGGHDVLRAQQGLLQELQDGVYRLFTGGPLPIARTPDFESTLKTLAAEHPESPQLLGELWRYWIGEAAADIYGVLNMGPAFALNAALYTAVLNKQLIPSIIAKFAQRIQTAKSREERERYAKGLKHWQQQDTESDDRPVLNSSPPDPPGPHDLDIHPPDALRLQMMTGAIANLKDFDDNSTVAEYVRKIEDSIVVGTTDAHGRPRPDANAVKLRGFIQLTSDTWREVTSKTKPGEQYEFPRKPMEIFAREVGRYVAITPLKTYKGKTHQDLVKWDKNHERAAQTIQKRLMGAGAKAPNCISSMGDDAQLLAGTTLACFDQPSLYTDVNERLAEALQQSFDRDEVWGSSGTALARVWSPPV